MLQDGQGNTPLHLAVAQVPVPWECVLELLERGAQVMSYMSCKTTPSKSRHEFNFDPLFELEFTIPCCLHLQTKFNKHGILYFQVSIRNQYGVAPADLAPPHLLCRLQSRMLTDCWLGLAGGAAAQSPPTPAAHTPGTPVDAAVIAAASAQTSAATAAAAAAATNTATATATVVGTCNSTGGGRLLRKFRASAWRTESVDEAASSASVEMLARSSTGSVRSRGSDRSPDRHKVNISENKKRQFSNRI